MMQSDARLLCDSMNWHARSLLAATGMLVASTLGDTYVVFFCIFLEKRVSCESSSLGEDGAQV